MSFDLATVVSSSAVAVISSWTVYRFTRRQSLDAESRTKNLAAASDLAQPLRDLQALMRGQGRVPVSQGEVAGAVSRWGQALDRQEHRLPDDWRHIRRSVLAAVGTVFGAVAFVHIRPDTADYPLEQPDFVWQDFGDEYIDYVLDALLRWGDSQGRRTIQQFDPWLVSTGRRRPIGQNGDGASRPSRLPET